MTQVPEIGTLILSLLTRPALVNTMHGSIHIVEALVLGFFVLVEIVVSKHFTDLWAVHIKGGEEVAQAVAARHGFIYRGQVLLLSRLT